MTTFIHRSVTCMRKGVSAIIQYRTTSTGGLA